MVQPDACSIARFEAVGEWLSWPEAELLTVANARSLTTRRRPTTSRCR